MKTRGINTTSLVMSGEAKGTDKTQKKHLSFISPQVPFTLLSHVARWRQPSLFPRRCFLVKVCVLQKAQAQITEESSRNGCRRHML